MAITSELDPVTDEIIVNLYNEIRHFEPQNMNLYRNLIRDNRYLGTTRIQPMMLVGDILDAAIHDEDIYETILDMYETLTIAHVKAAVVFLMESIA